MDRGTTYASALLRKLKTYEQFFASGKEQQAHGVFPQVLRIVSDARRKSMLSRLVTDINERIPNICAVVAQDGTSDIGKLL